MEERDMRDTGTDSQALLANDDMSAGYRAGFVFGMLCGACAFVMVPTLGNLADIVIGFAADKILDKWEKWDECRTKSAVDSITVTDADTRDGK